MSCKDCNYFFVAVGGNYRCKLYPDSALDTNLEECVAIERKIKEDGIKIKPVPITTDTIQRRLDAI